MNVNFLDTNIFICLFDETDLRKRTTAERLVEDALEGGDGGISFQIVQETLNVLMRQLKSPVAPEDARRFLDQVLAPLWKVSPSQALYHRAIDVHTRYRYSFYDSLVIASALHAGCTRLYSEDMQHGQQIDGLTITNPFRG